ncbi:MEDS domain-containing protein [Bacillus sp. SCS-153A]|uniref:MEDS domain-containing protein n=1 Tax=Rossellomorea sedimentorum TaxID=3115294 RepID=UPI003905E118
MLQVSEKVNHYAQNHACTHVLYCYENRESYLNNAVDYLVAGIENGESVILIESERNLLSLMEILKGKLTEQQFEKIHTISNFEFYLSHGSYHPPAIYEQLTKTVTPYFENDIPFRTWTNVEWGTLQEPKKIVDWFEREVDKVVHEHDMTLVCAYDAEKMPAELQTVLEMSHPHIMTDEDLLNSISYETGKAKIEIGE